MRKPCRYNLITAGTTIFLVAILVIYCRKPDKESDMYRSEITADNSYTAGNIISANFTGRESCKECHQKQYDLFQGSDHDMAMDTAIEETVLGDFNDKKFVQGGIITRFFRKDGRFCVNTEGSDGKFEDFEIKYVFGIRPLQQYLVEFPGGRFQMLPYCWDTRSIKEGGQRWFYIYDNERIPPDDILFWTRITQNWNYMCSECHSTNVRKQFDPASETYHTVWDEIDVSCESCHGPCSNHIEWARNIESGGSPEAFKNMGLVIRLKDTDNASWIFDDETGIAKRSVNRKNNTLVQMCARCHSRRSVITEDYRYGKHLLDTHWPSLLEEGLYFPDGQIQDEVYEYGSFLQSRMYKAGVNCKDCHEPHSGKVYIHGNALCYRCHLAEKYGSRSHHFHDISREGSNCFECHMPERTYMVINPRRDHSIRVPRPDLSDKLKTPNSCTKCHPEKTNTWATQYLKKWYGNVEKGKKHYGETFWAGRLGYPEALPGLIRLAEDSTLAPMIRATAIQLFQNYDDPSILKSLPDFLNDPDPLIRFASVNTLNIADENTLAEFVIPRLSDSIYMIRALAARLLTTLPPEYFTRTTRKLQDKAIKEYIHTQMINADHPSAHMNLGVMYLNLGDYTNAEASYKKAIKIEPLMTTAYINLADLYRMLDREAEGEQVLRNALVLDPEMAAVHYSLGLLLVRTGKKQEAMKHLEKAALIEPENARFSYVYGVGLYSEGRQKEAISYLESALKKNPYDRDILFSLSTFNQEQGNIKSAIRYAENLVEYYPQDQDYRKLLDFLQNL
jgi:tetratricopeptide (TPR) repeat protein